MKAKITKPEGYRCSPMGFLIVTFDKGTIVEGKVAEWAVADGAAKKIPANPVKSTKIVTPAEVK